MHGCPLTEVLDEYSDTIAPLSVGVDRLHAIGAVACPKKQHLQDVRRL